MTKKFDTKHVCHLWEAVTHQRCDHKAMTCSGDTGFCKWKQNEIQMSTSQVVIKSGLTVGFDCSYWYVFFIFPCKSKLWKTKWNSSSSIPVPQIRDAKRGLKIQYVPLNHTLIEKPKKLQIFEKNPFEYYCGRHCGLMVSVVDSRLSESRLEPETGSLCCILRQDTLLSQCLSLAWSIHGYRQI